MRIPYGIKCNINGGLCKVTRVDVEYQQIYIKKDDKHGGTYSIARGDVVKPYLRSLTSMTGKEKTEFRRFITWTFDCDYQANTLKSLLNGNEIEIDYIVELLDWLNAHHFDYRGLIEKGLALKAPKRMYN